MENGKPLFCNPVITRFEPVFECTTVDRSGQPMIQISSCEKDRHSKMIYEGDVVFWDTLKWFGVITYHDSLQGSEFRCDFGDGYGVLSEMLTEFSCQVICTGHLKANDNIPAYLKRAEEILIKNNYL